MKRRGVKSLCCSFSSAIVTPNSSETGPKSWETWRNCVYAGLPGRDLATRWNQWKCAGKKLKKIAYCTKSHHHLFCNFYFIIILLQAVLHWSNVPMPSLFSLLCRTDTWGHKVAKVTLPRERMRHLVSICQYTEEKMASDATTLSHRTTHTSILTQLYKNSQNHYVLSAVQF